MDAFFPPYKLTEATKEFSSELSVTQKPQQNFKMVKSYINTQMSSLLKNFLADLLRVFSRSFQETYQLLTKNTSYAQQTKERQGLVK